MTKKQFTVECNDGHGTRYVRDIGGIGDSCTFDPTKAIRCSTHEDAAELARRFQQRNGGRAWAAEHPA